MVMTLLTPPLRVGRRFLLPTLVAIVSLFALLTPAPSSAAPDMEIAVQDDAVLVGRLYYDRERALDQLRDLGVNRIRINLSGRGVPANKRAGRRYQPKSLVYHWDKY